MTGLIISLNRSGARFRVCVHGRVGLSGQQPHKRGSSLSYHRDTPRTVHRNHASLVICHFAVIKNIIPNIFLREYF